MVHRPIRDVFEYATDLERWPEWMGSLRRLERCSEGLLDLYATFEWVGSILGSRYEATWEVTVYEPPHMLACRAITGPFPASIRQVFQSLNGGTKLTMSGEGDCSEIFPDGGQVGKLLTSSGLQRDLDKLKECLESQASSVWPVIGGQPVGEGSPRGHIANMSAGP